MPISQNEQHPLVIRKWRVSNCCVLVLKAKLTSLMSKCRDDTRESWSLKCLSLLSSIFSNVDLYFDVLFQPQKHELTMVLFLQVYDTSILSFPEKLPISSPQIPCPSKMPSPSFFGFFAIFFSIAFSLDLHFRSLSMTQNQEYVREQNKHKARYIKYTLRLFFLSNRDIWGLKRLILSFSQLRDRDSIRPSLRGFLWFLCSLGDEMRSCMMLTTRVDLQGSSQTRKLRSQKVEFWLQVLFVCQWEVLRTESFKFLGYVVFEKWTHIIKISFIMTWMLAFLPWNMFSSYRWFLGSLFKECQRRKRKKSIGFAYPLSCRKWTRDENM